MPVHTFTILHPGVRCNSLGATSLRSTRAAILLPVAAAAAAAVTGVSKTTVAPSVLKEQNRNDVSKSIVTLDTVMTETAANAG